jgi:hypothetical protein
LQLARATVKSISKKTGLTARSPSNFFAISAGDQIDPAFELEARTTSALNHPNILTVHDIGTASTELGALHRC